MSIPKVIHYCWFGGNPLPKSAEKCIKSWKKYCPDYEIIEWNESNFDVHCNTYCKTMYEQKKWAFLTDYIRLKIIYDNGGVYFDTDVELLKPINPLLNDSAFMGLESTGFINTGLGFGAEKEHCFIKENMDYYEQWDSTKPILTCPVITTQALEKYSSEINPNIINNIADITIYPPEYFCAKNSHTGLIEKTKNSYSIHHFDASWNTKEERKKTLERWNKYKIENIKRFPKLLLRKIIGDSTVDNIKRTIFKK